ncbi:hypothetical protein J2W32_005670 [Variovorax boronicumulans]|uniref:Uncharacterized protein n=1 Tax=Variovorax boronicumulans TaxID=436515 RepID=A0AAW8D5I3_9BURK|nr:hypothetical protein [Variovorax boronicumulans]MDP9896616.1 hypothetical protein [Variovorax boronicumulans]MDQ0044051.1 hypothetical protein [Variovorax boronicumulans]MDQ0056601.1 hypothetical protein [Variovorax boronicumulans]
MEVSWKEMVVEVLCGNRQQLGGAMRLQPIRRSDATGFVGRHLVGFAPQRCQWRLRITQGLDRIRPSFFSNSFSNAPGDLQPPGRQTNSMNRFLNT